MKIILFILITFFIIISLSSEENADNLKKNNLTFKLNNVNIGGIALLNAGITSAIAGIVLFIVDDKINVSFIDKDSYHDSRYTRIRLQDFNHNYGLFAAGLVLMLTGGILITASIPMMLYKKKNMSLKLALGREFSAAFCYKF